MGTRINVLLEHDLSDFRNRESVLDRLAVALPSALAVRDYWHSTDPQSKHSELNAWRANPMSPRDPDLYRYTAPGSLLLTVTSQAASIHAGGRWRGFLTIEPLRLVHLAAFRQIAAALGSHALALYADSCEVDDLFWGGHSQWECIEWMERAWGPPQRSVDDINPKVALAAERDVPLVWFLESAEAIAEQGVAPK
jgi:hypothetical protein